MQVMSRYDRFVGVVFLGLHRVIGIEKKILNNILSERFHLMQIVGLCFAGETLPGKAWSPLFRIVRRIMQAGWRQRFPTLFALFIFRC
jgi:hypothetical protein